MTDVLASDSLALLPSWRLERSDNVIRCVGGPDALHVLSELEPASLVAVDGWIATRSVSPTSPETEEIRDFLITIGALDVSGIESEPIRWQSVGGSAVADRVANIFAHLPVSAVRPLTVVVRTSGSLTQLVEQTADVTGRHLLLDLTGHHTVSLGPFVTPGFTSCVGCYGTRLSHRWGDDRGPDSPASHRWAAVAAELLAIQVELIAARSSPLVNATINWDLQGGATSRDHLLRAPDCPVCAHQTSGSFVEPLGLDAP